MQQTTQPSHRWQRQLSGIALYGLIWSLPTAAIALLIAKLFAFGGPFGSPIGAGAFAIVFILTAGVLHHVLSRKYPHLLPAGDAARLCFDGTLSMGEKIERLQRDAVVWRVVLGNGLFLSLLVIAVLVLR
jgi:hypothetical protein